MIFSKIRENRISAAIISVVLSVLLVISMIASVMTVTMMLGTDYASAAETERTGTVNASSLFVRSGPGTSYASVGYVVDGEEVKILSDATDSNGGKWYYISYSGVGGSGKGYSSATYISETTGKSTTYTYDSDFEASMTSEGFPESYKDYLRTLHAKHPNWVFKAAQTGLLWNDVIKKEGTLGKTLVASSSPDSWKSKATGAYNSETGKYTSFDSGGWNAASTDIIKYYVDPRNFLNDSGTGIFQFLTHEYDSSTQNEAGLNAMLAGTFMNSTLADEPSATYASVLMDAGSKANVNPYVLASMIIVEQGSKGVGGCISGTVSGYEGYYNYFNIAAYATSSMTAVQRGLWYASQEGSYSRPWNTIRKSIEGGAEFYSANYVQNNKNTLYFKKWNVMNGASNVAIGQYMTNVQGAASEASQLKNAYSAVLDTAITFLIPVYENMPATACQKPSGTSTDDTDTQEEETVEKQTQTVTTRYTKYTREEKKIGTSFNLHAATTGDGTITYKSSDEAVATVDESGQVTVAGVGKATITVTAAETDKYTKASKKCTLTVNPMSEEEKQAIIDKYTAGLAKTNVINLVAKTSKKKVKLTWEKSKSGYLVDCYQIWRSNKKSSGYTKMITTSNADNCYYINTKGLKANTTYWYKVRGVRTVQGQTIYTPFTKIKVTTGNW